MSLVKENLHQLARHETGKLCLFSELFQILNQNAAHTAFHARERKLLQALETLSQSPTALALMQVIAETGDFQIIWDDWLEGLTAFDASQKKIYLSDQAVQDNSTVCLQKEMALILRRFWQMQNYYGAFTSQSVTEFVENYRNEEADAVAVAVQIAFELRLNGDARLWDHLKENNYADIVYHYQSSFDQNLKADQDGQALRLAYAQWFADFERAGACDDRALTAQGLDHDMPYNGLRLIV